MLLSIGHSMDRHVDNEFKEVHEEAAVVRGKLYMNGDQITKVEDGPSKGELVWKDALRGPENFHLGKLSGIWRQGPGFKCQRIMRRGIGTGWLVHEKVGELVMKVVAVDVNSIASTNGARDQLESPYDRTFLGTSEMIDDIRYAYRTDGRDMATLEIQLVNDSEDWETYKRIGPLTAVVEARPASAINPHQAQLDAGISFDNFIRWLRPVRRQILVGQSGKIWGVAMVGEHEGAEESWYERRDMEGGIILAAETTFEYKGGNRWTGGPVRSSYHTGPRFVVNTVGQDKAERVLVEADSVEVMIVPIYATNLEFDGHIVVEGTYELFMVYSIPPEG